MQTKEEALNKIKSLVQRFDEQEEFYKNKDYNETQTRQDFINPFWKALGWDIDNENGYAESYREVIHEDRVKVGRATKAPDYSFRLPGGKRLFFLEAKKPSVLIKDEIQPAYQIRRYGWSAKMPISVITDFEEFAIYDCTKKPKPTDKASTGRIKYLSYSDYINEFDFIWDTFSKERVLKGSFDKYIQSDKNKKGTTTVDKDFLQSLDKWRIEFAKNIALRNKNITEEELNFVVQNTIDRIIFLRIAEDRHAERYGDLQDTIKNGDYYKNLLQRFLIADQKYNSGLFDFQKDKISSGITIDNKIVKNIISELYYPVCPYEFSVLPIEILGNAYEQFLGKQITLTKGGRATIEEKPEVRKAGGVYYTPQYIVDYIVKNTVGKLIENKIPKEVSQIKIVDPACGSGSFLIGAYQYLLNWYKDFYTENGKPNKGKKDNPLTPTGELTTAEKKRILLNNIYGVDLDSNAVEVTKLSLLLKCMEGETKETIEAQTKLFHDRILPTLDNNIKSGNSLIDLDYYDSQLDFGEERKIKPFSWKKAFPEVFDRFVPKDRWQPFKEQYQKVKKQYDNTEELIAQYVHEPEEEYLIRVSGFDCVIGNPPYVFTRDVEFGAIVKKYYKNHYLNKLEKSSKSRENQTGKINLYGLFILKGIELLNKRGLMGYIIPNTVLRTTIYEGVRKFLLDNTNIEKIVDLKAGVFEKVTASTVLLFLGLNKDKDEILVIDNPEGTKRIVATPSIVNKTIFENNPSYSFNIFVENDENILFDKMKEKSIPLSEEVDVYNGIATYAGKQGISETKINNTYKKLLAGKDIKRYFHKWQGNYIEYIPEKLQRARDEKIFLADEKLIMQRIGGILITSYDNEQFYTFNSVNNLLSKVGSKYSLKFILALLNSKLFRFYYVKNFTNNSSLTVNISKTFLDKLPIVKIDFNNKSELAKYNETINLVDQLLQFNKELQEATLPEKTDQIKSRIEYCEDKINEIVYELYGLMEEDVSVISCRRITEI